MSPNRPGPSQLGCQKGRGDWPSHNHADAYTHKLWKEPWKRWWYEFRTVFHGLEVDLRVKKRIKVLRRNEGGGVGNSGQRKEHVQRPYIGQEKSMALRELKDGDCRAGRARHLVQGQDGDTGRSRSVPRPRLVLLQALEIQWWTWEAGSYSQGAYIPVAGRVEGRGERSRGKENKTKSSSSKSYAKSLNTLTWSRMTRYNIRLRGHSEKATHQLRPRYVTRKKWCNKWVGRAFPGRGSSWCQGPKPEYTWRTERRPG